MCKMLKKNKKAVEKFTWVLISIAIMVVLAILMILMIKRSTDVSQTTWGKIKDLNPFA